MLLVYRENHSLRNRLCYMVDHTNTWVIEYSEPESDQQIEYLRHRCHRRINQSRFLEEWHCCNDITTTPDRFNSKNYNYLDENIGQCHWVSSTFEYNTHLTESSNWTTQQLRTATLMCLWAPSRFQIGIQQSNALLRCSVTTSLVPLSSPKSVEQNTAYPEECIVVPRFKIIKVLGCDHVPAISIIHHIPRTAKVNLDTGVVDLVIEYYTVDITWCNSVNNCTTAPLGSSILFNIHTNRYFNSSVYLQILHYPFYVIQHSLAPNVLL